MAGPSLLAVFILALCLCCPVPLHPENKPLERLFIFGAVQYFILPDLSGLVPEIPGGSLIDPLPGFRAGLGCEWKHLRLSVESGRTKVRGNNPLVLEADMIPFMFQAGWDFTFFEKAGIRFGPVLGIGFARVGADHYKTVLDMVLDNRSRSEGAALLVHPGLEISWTFLKAFSLYAGGGASLVPEKDGPIPLPEIRAGIRLRPFTFHRKPHPEPAPFQAASERAIPEEAAPGEAVPETAIPEMFREVYTVYFGPDSIVPFESALAVLDQAGELLENRQDLRVTLNGYAAPFVSVAGQMAVSELRMRYCADYLQAAWNIEAERITKRWFGASALPEGADTTYSSLRVVEIIIENAD